MVDALVKRDANNDLISTLERVSEALAKRDGGVLAAGLDELTLWKSRLEQVINMTKEALKTRVLAEGAQVTDAGSKLLAFGPWKVRVRPGNSVDTLDDARVQAKLMAKGIAMDQGMQATVSWKADKIKLARLVDDGKLTTSDLADMVADRRWSLESPKYEPDAPTDAQPVIPEAL